MSVRNTVKSIQDIMRQDSGVDGDAQRISQLCWMFFLKIIDDQDQQLELMQDGYRSPIPKKLQWRSWAADPEGSTGDKLLDFVNGELFPALDLPRFLHELGGFVRSLHDAGFWHRDLSSGNVLVRGLDAAGADREAATPYDFSLVDLNRARRRGRLSLSQRARDLSRMNILRAPHRRLFLAGYWLFDRLRDSFAEAV